MIYNIIYIYIIFYILKIHYALPHYDIRYLSIHIVHNTHIYTYTCLYVYVYMYMYMVTTHELPTLVL